MKKILNYKTQKAIWRRSSELAIKMQGKAAKRHALSAGLIEQAASANTELERLNAFANCKANLYKKSYWILDDWYIAFNRNSVDDVVSKIMKRKFATDEPFTVGEYLDLIASKAPSEKDAFTNLDNAILA
ncbi:MAG: hypothetical protein IJS29_02360 [Selenomonadaceae bacterium]|nr:hypothetical protein [Selenomonadaceae bacterium]